MNDKRPQRVLLVSLNCECHYSLALGYLKLFAMEDPVVKAGTWIRALQLSASGSTNGLVLRILAERPQVVGFSCNIWNIQRTMKVARRLKYLMPHLTIILGGQEVTHSSVDYLELCPAVDIIVNGEGENIFRQLLRARLENGLTKLEEIPGILFRRDGRTIVNPPAPMIDDLDSIPSPYLGGEATPPPGAHLGFMIETSRGCRFHCAFCFEGSRFPKVRSFALERVEREIAWAVARGIRSFHFLDPVLGNADAEKLRVIHDMIGKHIVPRGDYSISVEVHAELLNENNYRYLEHFTLFDIGLQSITPQALGHLRRGFNQPRFLRGVELLKRLKGQTNIYLILGLPGENFFSFLLSVKFAVACDVSRLFINHLCVLNGTTLRREAAELKLRHKPTPPYHATSNYSFGGGELSMAHLFAETMVREHDCAVAMSPGVISPS